MELQRTIRKSLIRGVNIYTGTYVYSSVLYEETLMKRIIGYVMKKLQVMDRDSTKVVQLLEILSALCTCKGVPVKQNQRKLRVNY